MWKTIAAAISLLKDGMAIAEKILAAADKKKRRQLAKLIHIIYIRTNECITTGEQIIEVLSKYITDCEQITIARRPMINVCGIILDDLIEHQIINLSNLSECISEYSEIIRVVDAELYERLGQFVAFKGIGIDWLAALLKGGEINFDGMGADDVAHLAYVASIIKNNGECKDSIQESSYVADNFFAWYGEVSVISTRMRSSSFDIKSIFKGENDIGAPFSALVDREQLERLADLLRRNDLKLHLDQARKDASVLKGFIEANFSVVDLMLDVGDKQLKKKPRM